MEYGHVKYDHAETAGEIFELYNSIPRYRYNTIFGYSPVHFVKVLDWGGLETVNDLSMTLQSKILAGKVHPGSAPNAISVLTRRYFQSEAAFMVIGGVVGAGVMQVSPLPQGCLSGANRVVFTLSPYEDKLKSIPNGAKTAVYCVDMSKMQCVLVKGEYRRISCDDFAVGVVEIDMVYNPMMPKNCYIYPRTAIEPVRVFENVVYEYNV
jgi:hypothetical protein